MFAASRWSLRRRIGGLLLAAGIVLVALLAAGTAALLQVRDRQNKVSVYYYKAIDISNSQFIELLDAESGLRAYALTGDRSFLGPLDDLQSQQSRDQGSRLRALVSGEPEVQRQLAVASATAQQWWTSWALPVQDAVARGGPKAVGTAEVMRGTQLFEQLRGEYETFVASLVHRRSQALTTLQHQTALLFASSAATLLLTAALAVALWMLLLRWVVRPVDALAGETRAVAEGNLDHVISAQGPPEIEALASDVEVMRRGIVAQLWDVRRARDDVESARALLEARSADLERSNRDLEQFAYVASHDLQEPLRKVASFCQLLQKRYGGQLDERADQYIEFAVDGAKRMQQLINDLLAFSRVGRVTARQSDVDLQNCLDAAMRNLSSALEAVDAEVTSDPLPVVRGEAGLLVQLFQNLVGNALKFRRPDVAALVHVGASRHEDEWEFCVQDNGIGIEAQYAERVFVIFQRLHPRDEYEGTGIGLALCRKIVEYHGGRIWIDANGAPRTGTTIRWTLPVVEELVGAPPAGSTREVTP